MRRFALALSLCLMPVATLAGGLGEMTTAEKDAFRAEVRQYLLDNPEVIIGDPIGRDALIAALTAERIPYTPEQLVEISRRELAWCRQENGDTDPGTLHSINQLAVDLRDVGELGEAEHLFRDLIDAQQQVLEPEDFDIGRALGGLSRTLELARKLEDALAYRQQALAHRLEYEGSDAWWTNRNRLDLARILQKLERFDQAIALLDELQTSMAGIEDPDQDDQELLAEAVELRALIQPDGSGKNE